MADRAAEVTMRALIAARFPSHAVFGEEGGLTRGVGASEELVWVLDPIDGTKSFITGKPLFGTLVALVHAPSGTPLLGIIDQPVLRERWLGVRGQQTTMNGAAVSTRLCPELRDAYLYSTTPLMFDAQSQPAYQALADAVRIPMFGCDCYAYGKHFDCVRMINECTRSVLMLCLSGLLSMGHCDLVAEADLKPYDFMALVPVVEGAGGVMSDWRGQPLRWRLSDSGEARGEVLAAGDAHAHAAALAILSTHFR
jgi:inositol-phosphate phosphatase/L-galactose 1-phosphate phosphatase/histidinol-phosphatase